MRGFHPVAIFAAALLAAPVAAPAAEPARIYVYAQQLTAARSWIPIEVDDAVVARVKQGTLFAIDLPPGQHSLGPESGVPASIDIESGEEVFVRLDWSFKVGYSPVPALVRVAPEWARKEIRYLSYISAKKIRSALVLKEDPREPAKLQLKTRPR